MKAVRRIWIVALVLLGAALSLAVNAKRERPAASPAASKPAAPIVAAGRVEPAGEEVRIGSQLDGRLERVLVDEGDAVRAGQVIAIVDNGDFHARVKLARAALAEREATLERLRNGAREEEKREAEARLREAEAQLRVAEAERGRRRALRERGAVSHSEYDLTVRDAEMARARVEAARERLAVARSQTRAEDMRRAEAEVESARASLAEAEAMLAKTLIRSPIGGRVLRRYRKSGESVSANGDQPIVAIGNTARLHVRVDVDEADVSRLRIGQRAFVRAEAYGERRFSGRVVRIGQALGRKNVRTDEPSERVDRKILETLVELDPGQALPVGLRVDAYLDPGA
jgi:HlyD family secretion protein